MDGPSQSTKRQLDTSLETSSLPTAKRARRFETNLQQLAPKHPGASFLLTDRISEWLESIESDRETRCQSDGYLHAWSDDDLISRDLARSVPQMAPSRVADGFAVPSIPGPSPSNAVSSRSSRPLVEDPYYRSRNLVSNHIYMREQYEKLPDHVSSIVNHVCQDRKSLGPSSEEVWQDQDLTALETTEAGESEVEDYFKNRVFPKPKQGDSLHRSDRQPMSKDTVPNAGSLLKVSYPIPDMLYGYKYKTTFPQQQTQIISMGSEPVANTKGLIYPFFVIEFKGYGAELGVATNQCLGGSASCVNIAEGLNRRLKECKSRKVRLVNSTVFSIAMNGTEARLYVSWKHNELDYYMQKVKSFSLQDPEHYIEFRKYVKNIINWGENKRSKEIRNSLDTLLKESQKQASKAAKSRPPPTKGSTSKSKKHQPPPSRKGRSSRHNTEQARSEQEGAY